MNGENNKIIVTILKDLNKDEVGKILINRIVQENRWIN